MKKLLTACLLVVVSGLTSCDMFFSSFETTWHVTKIEPADNDEESESIYTDAFLSFYEHGVASFFNKNEHDKSLGQPVYRIGEWIKEGGEVKLTLKHTTINVTFAIVEQSNKWLVLEIKEGPKESIGTVLKCQPSELYRNRSFDLLAPSNNTWRVRPQQKESRAQIQARVAAHVDFLIGYFDMVQKKSQSYFEVSILQTPFQFYSNGIGLKNQFEADNAWQPNFYDEADAAVGAKMLIQGLASIDVYPADDVSFTKGYYNAMLLISEHIKK